MAETVGREASLMAVMQLADSILSICKLCIENLEDCPKDFPAILLELSSARALFDSLNFAVLHDAPSAEFLGELGGPNGAIQACHAAVEELESPLSYDDSTRTRRKKTNREKAHNLLRALASPLEQDKCKALLALIAQHKTTIGTALLIELGQGSQDVEHGLTQMPKALTESEKHDMLKWIPQNGPSSLHYIAREKIEENTWKWVMVLPEVGEWFTLQTRCLGPWHPRMRKDGSGCQSGRGSSTILWSRIQQSANIGILLLSPLSKHG